MQASAEVTEVEIPADILAELEGIRHEEHWNRYEWAPWQDAVLLRCWGQPGYVQPELVRVLGNRGKKAPSLNTARARYRELKG